MFNRIQELNTSKTNWALRVRLVRFYPVPVYTNKNVINTMECVFHDQEGNRVHATIRRERLGAFKERIKEGNVYILRNFVVTPNSMKYRTTNCAFNIIFNHRTTLVDNNVEFPRMMFNFKPFLDLQYANQVDLTEMFDIIGSVRSIHFPRPRERDGATQKLVELVLEDPNQQTIRCTLWADFVDAIRRGVEKTPNFMIVVVLMVHPRLYKGDVYMTNSYNGSRLIINGSDQEILDYKDRFDLHGDEGYNGQPIVVTTEEEEHGSGEGDFVTIESLFQENLNGRFWVTGEVIDIETGDGWWYLACRDCARKVAPRCGRFECLNPACKSRHDAVMRYKVKIRIMDKTANAAFILWDTACQELFGKKAATIVGDMKGEDGFPLEILNLIEKKVICLAQVQNDSTKRGEVAFSVQKIKLEKEINALEPGESSHAKELEATSQEKNEKCKEKYEEPIDLTVNETVAANDDNMTSGKRVGEIDTETLKDMVKRNKRAIQVKIEKC
ncbi:unnamed protein product [Cuscuta epithymum]|uniref:Uncharacterized protein n=1 Tax=Cuscuta epithymum TaxID=186058 RepID=A0AAV0EKP2_9ASTE|nr:unnamed protein product [Cuscuta epithymum]